tara:strand:- start:357 stop:1247 length:891 start_codon:yes stop_codon:yes gene_type:complete
MTHSYDHATATGRKLVVLNEALARSRSLNARYPDTLSIDKDTIKSGIQEILSPSNTTISFRDIQSEERRLAVFDSQFADDFSKSGTWSMRVSNQTNAQKAKQTLQITARKAGVQGIINNPKNIERWVEIQIKEKEVEEERLLQIELEKARIQNEIDRKEFARLQAIREEEERLALIEAPKRASLQASRFVKIEQDNIKRLQEMKNQNITFNEQINSGDFNETPITDVNLSSGCSECTGTELSSMMILKEGYHRMPDGSMMKDIDMEKKPLNNNMKIAGIIAASVIGLLLYTKGGLK